MDTLYDCQNCGKPWRGDELNAIHDIRQRVEPGEPMPAGECPECGALCHEEKKPEPATPSEYAAACGRLHRLLAQTEGERDAATMAAKANAKECETLRAAVHNWIALCEQRADDSRKVAHERDHFRNALAQTAAQRDHARADADSLRERLSNAIREREIWRAGRDCFRTERDHLRAILADIAIKAKGGEL